MWGDACGVGAGLAMGAQPTHPANKTGWFCSFSIANNGHGTQMASMVLLICLLAKYLWALPPASIHNTY
jgi:hypothetical protein